MDYLRVGIAEQIMAAMVVRTTRSMIAVAVKLKVIRVIVG